jgi:hypothetical protein
LREKLKELKERIAEAETTFSTEVSTQALQTQVSKMQMDLDAAHGKAALAKAKRTDNFSHFILQDRLAVATRRAQLGSAEQSVVRLLNVLPKASREANTKNFSSIQSKAKKAIEEAIEAEKASDKQKDWSQSARLKIHIISLAMIEIEVALFADGVLNVARKIREAAEHLYRICNRIWYLLFASGLGLAIYANLAHIKGLIGGE